MNERCVRSAAAAVVDNNAQQENEKNKFSSELRLFLVMLKVESILLIFDAFVQHRWTTFSYSSSFGCPPFQLKKHVSLTGYTFLIGHTVGSDLNRWFTDSQKTLCYVLCSHVIPSR